MSNENVATRAKPTVTIRAATDADHDAMKGIWHEAFGARFFGGDALHDAMLRWGFAQNPERYPTSIDQWVAEVDGRVVAAWSAMPVHLMIAGQPIEACWLQNVAVAAAARGLGIARTINRAIVAHHRITLGVGVVAASRPLFASEGVHFVKADRFARLSLRHRSVVKDIARAMYRRELPQAQTLGVALSKRITSALQRSAADVVVTAVEQPPENLDAFFQRVTRAIGVIPRRSPEKMRWLLSNPRLKCSVFVAQRGGELCGYAIVRPDGMLLELLVHPDDTAAFAPLIARAKAFARQHGAEELSGIVPGVPALAACYDARGFVPVPEADFGLFFSKCDEPALRPLIENPERWYMSLADSDLWSFRL